MHFKRHHILLSEFVFFLTSYEKPATGFSSPQLRKCRSTYHKDCTSAYREHQIPCTKLNSNNYHTENYHNRPKVQGDHKELNLNTKEIYIGNIDWNVSCDVIFDTILTLFQKYNSSALGNKNLASFQQPFSRQHIKIKPKTNKKRDLNKLHGGSLILSFINEHDASIAMDLLSSQYVNIDDNFQSKLNPKSKLNIRWCLMMHIDNGSKNDSAMFCNSESGVTKDKNQSLLEHRKNRALKYQRQRQRVAQKTDELINMISPQFLPDVIETLDIMSSPSNNTISSSIIDWSIVPAQVDPTLGGRLKAHSNRGYRKQVQVEAFIYVLQNALLSIHDGVESNMKVADLGSGAGNLSVPLAWFLKHHANIRIVAVDLNARALDQLDRRAKSIGLNIETVEEDLLNLISSPSQSPNSSPSSALTSCAAVVSLHACGAASDLAINAAVSHSLPFAVSPCCIGKVKSIRSPNLLPSLATERGGTPDGIISYPRSKKLTSILEEGAKSDGNNFDLDDYSLILSAADYSMSGIDESLSDISIHSQQSKENILSQLSEKEKIFHKRGRMAKMIVERDRLKWAEEQGYYVRMMELPRIGAIYPKRELLLGAKLGTAAASRISRLPYISTTQLQAKIDNGYDENDERLTSEEDSMDLDGFKNYLIPYIVAAFGSLVVTALFVKYILMDY